MTQSNSKQSIEPIHKIQQEILDEIEFLTPRERYDFIIDQAMSLSLYPESLKTDDRLVPGCVSKVWMDCKLEEGRLILQSDSDSIFVKGLVALLLRMYSGHRADEILNSNLNFLVQSGLIQTLSATRSNGAASMMRRILKEATEAKNSHLLKSLDPEGRSK